MQNVVRETFFSANNLAVVGPEEFYVSNDHYFNNHYLIKLEYFCPYIRLGSVVYYNKGKATVADHFLLTPNGMTIDKSRK